MEDMGESLGDKSGKNDKEADFVAIIRIYVPPIDYHQLFYRGWKYASLE